MFVLDIIGWSLLIAANVLPEKWFKSEKQAHITRITFCMVALVIFVSELLNLWFKWY